MTKRNKKTFIVFLSLVSGTLCWGLLEKILSYFSIPLSLSVGPIGFDALVLSVFMLINPGSLIGLGSALLFTRRKKS